MLEAIYIICAFIAGSLISTCALVCAANRWRKRYIAAAQALRVNEGLSDPDETSDGKWHYEEIFSKPGSSQKYEMYAIKGDQKILLHEGYTDITYFANISSAEKRIAQLNRRDAK